MMGNRFADHSDKTGYIDGQIETYIKFFEAAPYKRCKSQFGDLEKIKLMVRNNERRLDVRGKKKKIE